MNLKPLTVLLLILIGCSESKDDQRDPPPTSCSIDKDVLYCTDGTVYTFPEQPKDGKDAAPCKITGQSISCPDGSIYTFPVPSGGRDGVNGIAGADGSSCSVEGNVVRCTDGTSYEIPTPKDGQDGQDGRDSIVRIIDPCGPNNSGVDELLFVLSTGEIVAWYQNVGLVALKDGNYVVTDGSKCRFKILNGVYSE